jgi:hypothetical protein
MYCCYLLFLASLLTGVAADFLIALLALLAFKDLSSFLAGLAVVVTGFSATIVC